MREGRSSRRCCMRFLYICAEALLLWLILMVISIGLVWGWRGFDDIGQLAIALCAIAYAPVAFKTVLVGDRHSIWFGLYRPVRILSYILPGIGAFRRESTLAGF